jgi:ABC-2 type transport system permease protein
MSSADLLTPAAQPAAPTPAIVRHRGVLRRQLRNEFRLIFRRRRNIAMLIVLGAVPVLIGTAVKVSAPRPGEGPAFIGQITGNGLFLAFAALTICLPVFLPLAVAVIGGDCIAGEANTGTLRYLLTVPVSRTRLLLVKSIGTLTYIAVAIAVVALIGSVMGVALFGTHGVTLLSGDTVSVSNGLLRTIGVAAYVFVDLLGLAAIAVFFSTMTEVPVGAMAATVAIVIAFAVLDSVPQLGGIRGLLLTHHWLDFGELLRQPIATQQLLRDTVVPLAYTAIFGSAAWSRLSTADITS